MTPRNYGSRYGKSMDNIEKWTGHLRNADEACSFERIGRLSGCTVKGGSRFGGLEERKAPSSAGVQERLALAGDQSLDLPRRP